MTMRVDQTLAGLIDPSKIETSQIRQRIQVAVLKQALDVQKMEAEELAKMVQPKGRVIDIRV